LGRKSEDASGGGNAGPRRHRGCSHLAPDVDRRRYRFALMNAERSTAPSPTPTGRCGLRPPPPDPPPRAAGKFNSSDHAPACTSMVVVFGSALAPRASGSANNIDVLPRQSNFPAACAAPRPALGAVSCVYAVRESPRRASARPAASGRGVGDACGGGAWYARPEPNSENKKPPKTDIAAEACRRSFHGRIHQDAEE